MPSKKKLVFRYSANTDSEAEICEPGLATPNQDCREGGYLDMPISLMSAAGLCRPSV